MKILILIITVTWSFGGGYQNSPNVKIMSSPEQAAIYIYNDRSPSFVVEPDHKKYQLFEIDIEASSIKEIAIPEIKFSQPKLSYTLGEIP